MQIFLINCFRCTLAPEPEKSPSPQPVNPSNRKISSEENSGQTDSSLGLEAEPPVNRSSPPPLEELDSRPSSPDDLDSPQILEEVMVDISIFIKSLFFLLQS